MRRQGSSARDKARLELCSSRISPKTPAAHFPSNNGCNSRSREGALTCSMTPPGPVGLAV